MVRVRTKRKLASQQKLDDGVNIRGVKGRFCTKETTVLDINTGASSINSDNSVDCSLFYSSLFNDDTPYMDEDTSNHVDTKSLILDTNTTDVSSINSDNSVDCSLFYSSLFDNDTPYMNEDISNHVDTKSLILDTNTTDVSSINSDNSVDFCFDVLLPCTSPVVQTDKPNLLYSLATDYSRSNYSNINNNEDLNISAFNTEYYVFFYDVYFVKKNDYSISGGSF
jgi:hypothetical protein